MNFYQNSQIMKIDADQLKKHGWHLSPEAINELSGNFNQIGEAMKHLLETDLRDVGSTWVPEGLRKNKIDRLETDGILQVMKVRNISASKDHQDSKFAPRLLRIMATDGKESVSLLDMDNHPKLSIDTLPGAKILIKNKPELWDGHVIVKRNCLELLGGSVQRLVEAWRLKRDFGLASGGGPLPRRAADGSGPPPFIPFGSRNAATGQVKAAKGFRAMDKVRETTSGQGAGEAEEEMDTEFDSHRRAVIEEARQQGKEASTKMKGFAQQKNIKLPPGRGVDQMERQEEIRKIVAMGFQPRDAAAALRKTGGDVQKAVDSLLAERTAGVTLDSDEGRGRGRGGRGRGRGRKGDPMDSDDEGPSRAPPPSGPATLADFVTKKAPEKPPAPPHTYPPPPPRPGDGFSPGDQVMARWRDGQTYRARVEEVYRADGVISVFFVDYGEHDVIPLEHVQHMQTSKPSGDRFNRGRGRGGPPPRQSYQNERQRENDRQRPPYQQPPSRDQRQHQRPRGGRSDHYEQNFYEQSMPCDPYTQYHDYRPPTSRRYDQQMGYQMNYVMSNNYVNQFPPAATSNVHNDFQHHEQQNFIPRGMEFRRGGQGRQYSARSDRR